jgi:hypothetical protein
MSDNGAAPVQFPSDHNSRDQLDSGKKIGFHYSRFWPKRTTSLFANQIFSRPKNRRIPILKRQPAKTG